MKGIIKHIARVFLLAVPMACNSETIAYSPSINGQPLIFHINTDELQISQLSAVTWTQLENALLIRSSYTRHLENSSNRSCCTDWSFWADGMGQWQHQDTEHEHQFGYDDITGGLTLGADTCFKDFLVGVAASYTYSNLWWKESGGHSRINSYYGGLYGSWNNGCIYVDASLLGAFSNYQTSRHLHFRRNDRHVQARHHSWEALTGIEAGVMLQKIFCNIDLVPFVGVDYVYLSQQEYRENGLGSLNLNVKSRNDQFLQSELGLQFTRRMLCELFYRSWVIAPNVSLSYINQTPLTGRSYYSNFVGHDYVFSGNGWNFERNLGAVALNFNFSDCAQNMTFTLHYDGQFGKNYWNQTGSILCNLCF